MESEDVEMVKRREKWRNRKRQSRAKKEVREREKVADKAAKRRKRLAAPLSAEDRDRKNQERRQKYAERVGRPVRRYHRRAKKIPATETATSTATETSAVAAATMAAMAEMPPTTSAVEAVTRGPEEAARNSAVAGGMSAASAVEKVGGVREESLLGGGPRVAFQAVPSGAFRAVDEIHQWLNQHEKNNGGAAAPMYCPVERLESIVSNTALLKPEWSARLLQLAVLSGGSRNRVARFDVEGSKLRSKGVPEEVDETLISRIDYIEKGSLLVLSASDVPEKKESDSEASNVRAESPAAVWVEMPATTCAVFKAAGRIRAGQKSGAGALCVYSLWSTSTEQKYDEAIVAGAQETAEHGIAAPEEVLHMSQSDFISWENNKALPKAGEAAQEENAIGKMEEV